MADRFIIIDSNALLHRAFHALPPLANKNGQPTGAVYGYLLTLFKAVKDLKANFIVATFDTKAKTFRHHEFTDYKANRAATPDGIISQIPIAKEVLSAFSIPVFAKDGFEADDLIATIAVQAEKTGAEVFIVSGDLDNLQLVTEKIKVYTLGKGIKDTIIYDAKKDRERFGVDPKQMIDFKALTGDPSDNVPGVPGIGKTTAAEIINKFNSIDNLYSELATDTAALKTKVKKDLKNNKETALLSRHLVETKKDVDIDFNLAECRFDFDVKKAENKLRELDFNSLIERVVQLKN